MGLRVILLNQFFSIGVMSEVTKKWYVVRALSGKEKKVKEYLESEIQHRNEGENIDRALKKFKRKFEKTGVVKELRARQQFDKQSVIKRQQKLHAIYVQKLQSMQENN